MKQAGQCAEMLLPFLSALLCSGADPARRRAEIRHGSADAGRNQGGSASDFARKEPFQRSNRRLLVVGRDAFSAQVLSALAAGSGWTAETEADAERARQRLTKGTFDVVIFDVALIGMAVIEIVKRLRSLCPQARIIVTGEEEYMQQLSQYPWLFDGLLTKPVRASELAKVLTRLTDSAG